MLGTSAVPGWRLWRVQWGSRVAQVDAPVFVSHAVRVLLSLQFSHVLGVLGSCYVNAINFFYIHIKKFTQFTVCLLTIYMVFSEPPEI